jgi:hypothetical protein
MLSFIVSGIGAIASYQAQKRQQKAQEAAYRRMLAEQAAARKRQAAIDAKNRELAKKDASNKFTDMSKAASKAGINPLTALRATGGAGFGAYGGYNGLMQSTIQAPILSKQSFAENLGTRLANTYLDMKINAPIDKYNAEVRKLDLEARKLDIKLGKSELDKINAPDPYAGYGQYIPVKNGLNIQLLDVTVAKRLGIKPNDRLTAGDLEEILGEFHGGLQGAVGSRTGTEALKPHNQSGGQITVDRLPPIATEPAMQGWVDNIWNGITQANPLGGILSTPGVFSGKTPGEKWPFNNF